MNEETKNKLKIKPTRVCAVCQRKKNSCNPVVRCFECKKNFCYGHIFGGQVKTGMSKSEEVRSVCETCRKAYGYRPL